jgi:hypothetical protein
VQLGASGGGSPWWHAAIIDSQPEGQHTSQARIQPRRTPHHNQARTPRQSPLP